MTDHTAGPLSFMAHMRRGLGRLRDAQGQVSAQVTLASSAQTAPLDRQITLAGPEHVTGLSTSQIKRLVPAPGSTDFAPNFFAAVEFSLPDLPWMFTPETPSPGPDGDPRLPPWLVLAVIEEGAGVRFTEPGADSNGRLQISTPAQVAQQLPPLDDFWAWAHVQCTADLTQKTAQEALDATPDLFRSRLICPRRLVPQTDYIACLLPAYRGGVEMGLGRVVGDTPHAPAWTGAETEVMLPVYYAWRFRTAQKGDFEDLVRRLTPVELAAGQVALNLSEPGDPRLPQGGGTMSGCVSKALWSGRRRKRMCDGTRIMQKPINRAWQRFSPPIGLRSRRKIVPMTRCATILSSPRRFGARGKSRPHPRRNHPKRGRQGAGFPS